MSFATAGADAPAVCAPAPAKLSAADEKLLDDIQRRTFRWFWDITPPATGLVPDRAPSLWSSSIAAVGFGLTAYPVGAERGYVTREQARDRTLATLRFFEQSKQGTAVRGMTGHKGFYYHFIDLRDGGRKNDAELSSVDSALLFAGMLTAQAYFDRDDAAEREIRAIAQRLFDRADWTFFQSRGDAINMGWDPRSGLLSHDWHGYNEAMLVYLLALGSATHPVEPKAWSAWTRDYDDTWGTYQGFEHLGFAPMFGHHFSHVWYDFRGIRDAYMRRRGLDYFENSRRAALAQRAYAQENPQDFRGYGDDIWGLTASDGPGDLRLKLDGRTRTFLGYSARGAGLRHTVDDGTLAPTAALGSLPFAPEIVIPAARAFIREYGDAIYGEHGFVDAFNPTFTDARAKHAPGRIDAKAGWVDVDRIGIDQGPILLMIENHRSGLVWNLMRKHPVIVRGLRRAGFTGGWLDACTATTGD